MGTKVILSRIYSNSCNFSNERRTAGELRLQAKKNELQEFILLKIKSPYFLKKIVIQKIIGIPGW